MSTPNQNAPIMSQETAFSPSQSTRPRRILACVLCQQRKVKCDRKFPCSSCVKSRVECVPSSLVQRQRKRRFPERVLLERIRKYESILRQNNIPFEPLHKDSSKDKESLATESGHDSPDEESMHQDSTLKPERGYEAKNIWQAMTQGYADGNESSDDNIRETAVKKAYDQSIGRNDNDHLLFGSHNTNIDLSNSHPEPVQIFKLWQIYLDNINPLLKVTHSPSLQGRIIEAASNLINIKPNLEALMFGIYCASILSLSVEDCQTMFATSRDDLLSKYQFGCQQALSNCKFLRSSDRECLTAFFLYLISVRASTVPQSLSSMLGIAIRIAQRMGIQSESALSKYPADEAEMRRRLWWSLVLFDTRISETANTRIVTLDPTWDCRVPLNINEPDIRPEMKRTSMQGNPTDAIFAIVRAELGDFTRNTAFHLDFTNPALKAITNKHQDPVKQYEELDKLEKMIEDRHFKSCNPENPLHFMTIWTTRGYLAKCRLLHCLLNQSSEQPMASERDNATAQALKMLECDTKIMTSPLTKGFLWFNHLYFPFPAYIQITQDLRRRPNNVQSQQAWEVMSDSYNAWFKSAFGESSPFFQLFTKMVLQSWEACEAASKQSGEELLPPKIISSIQNTLAQSLQHAQAQNLELPDINMDMNIEDFAMPMPMDFPNPSMPLNMGVHGGYGMMGHGMFPGSPGHFPMHPHMRWAALGGHPGWGHS